MDYVLFVTNLCTTHFTRTVHLFSVFFIQKYNIAYFIDSPSQNVKSA